MERVGKILGRKGKNLREGGGGGLCEGTILGDKGLRGERGEGEKISGGEKALRPQGRKALEGKGGK